MRGARRAVDSQIQLLNVQCQNKREHTVGDIHIL